VNEEPRVNPHEHYVTDAERRVAERLRGPFGNDTFGRLAERFARFFGTPQFIIGQTVLVVAWIAVNAVAISLRWDPYPFILLNLAFSTQAAYAAPLILLAQTRQADRDKVDSERFARMGESQRAHVEHETEGLRALLQTNTELTEKIASLTSQLHVALCDADGTPRPGLFNPGR
jgi:uncharacterized membrane protein